MPHDESGAANQAAARRPASEETPLLDDETQHATGYPEQNPEHGEPVIKEASMKDVMVIMSSIWLGVFFAALGTMPSIIQLDKLT